MFYKMLQNHLRVSVTWSVIFADVSQNELGPMPVHYIVIPYPQQMVQMAFCDLSHTFHKKVTNVSPTCFCHPTVGNFDVSTNAYSFSQNKFVLHAFLCLPFENQSKNTVMRWRDLVKYLGGYIPRRIFLTRF